VVGGWCKKSTKKKRFDGERVLSLQKVVSLTVEKKDGGRVS